MEVDKFCQLCNASFKSRSGKNIYCSAKCREEYQVSPRYKYEKWKRREEKYVSVDLSFEEWERLQSFPCSKCGDLTNKWEVIDDNVLSMDNIKSICPICKILSMPTRDKYISFLENQLEKQIEFVNKLKWKAMSDIAE